MITAAHVGIGIKGVEGLQAARASDYSIGEFKLLRRLLLYYGRENYRRNSYLICYNFYKNLVLVLPQFWYAFFNGLSGQTIYNPFLFQLYNIFYASLPIVIYAIFDKESKGSIFMNNPKLYNLGRENKVFNVVSFWTWIFFGFLHSCMITIFLYFSIGINFNEGDQGYMQDMWSVGMGIFGVLITITNLKVLTMSNTHSPLSLIVIFGSIVVYIATFAISSEVGVVFGDYGAFKRFKEFNINVFNIIIRLFSSGPFYLVLLLNIVSISYFDVALDRFMSLS